MTNNQRQINEGTLGVQIKAKVERDCGHLYLKSTVLSLVF